MSKRFFVDQENFFVGLNLELNSDQNQEEIKHMYKVLRKKSGDRILLTNGRYQQATARIESIDSKRVRLSILEIQTIAAGDPPISIWQGLLKGPRMDWLVEKLTELNVAEIQPVQSEFVVIADAKEESLKRQARWERISHSAIKQSGSGALIRFAPTITIEEACSQQPNEELRLLFHPAPKQARLGEFLEICKSKKFRRVVLAVGPEGGWSEAEAKLLQSHGFQCVGLGSNILRGETAAIVACALVRDWIDFWRR